MLSRAAAKSGDRDVVGNRDCHVLKSVSASPSVAITIVSTTAVEGDASPASAFSPRLRIQGHWIATAVGL